MGARERVAEHLSRHGARCDDCLSIELAIKPRQTINQICRGFVGTGDVKRVKRACPGCHSEKLVNVWQGGANRVSENRLAGRQSSAAETPSFAASHVAVRPWCWEGNVQASIVDFLADSGYRVHRVADTESRESGKDIEATSPAGRALWVSVKGYPEKSQNVQARHWFAGALFDLILYRDDRESVDLAIGLPAGFTTYSNLANRVTWLRRNLPFKICWVHEDGRVLEE